MRVVIAPTSKEFRIIFDNGD